jgi:tetratricopeptide (TPR) repeat protein
MMSGDLDDIARDRFATARRIADELGQPTLRWLVSSWDAFRLQMLGDLQAAEEQLNSAFELGQRTGQPDAFTWYAGMLWLFVRERGDIGSLTEMVETELERNPGLPAWSIVLGMAYCETDRYDDARALIRGLVDEEGTHFPNDVMWVCAVVGLLDLAETVGDTVAAERLYDALLPFRGQSTHGGICYLGSAERYLGLGARALGRLDDAVAHGEAAVAREQRMGTVTWAGLAYAELAVTLRRRGADGDLARAEQLAQQAVEIAESTGSAYITQRLARAGG